jgi:hypothetical protein
MLILVIVNITMRRCWGCPLPFWLLMTDVPVNSACYSCYMLPNEPIMLPAVPVNAACCSCLCCLLFLYCFMLLLQMLSAALDNASCGSC